MATPYEKTSPSQISTFELCERRWHFGSIKKLPQPQSKEAAEGEILHKQIENYALEGTTPAHPSVLAASKWDRLAAPGDENVIIEAKTTVPPLMVGGILINGRVDYTDARDPVHPVVIDWKSKGKTLKAMSKKALTDDVQLNIYGAWVLELLPEAVDVTLGHGYLGRDVNNFYFKPVLTDPLPRHVIQARVALLAPTVEAMVAKAAVEDTLELKFNTTACNAFGQQCPFYSKCFPLPMNRMATLFPEQSTPAEQEATMSLLEKLKSNAGAATIPAPTNSTSSTPVPVAATITTTAPAGVLTLYIDCLPEKGVPNVTRLEDEIARRSEEIVKSHGAKTLNDAPLNFGKGKDLLAESFRASPPSGAVVCTSGGMSTAIIEVLKPLAPIVWRGF